MTRRPWENEGFWVLAVVSWSITWITICTTLIFLGHAMEWNLSLITIHAYLALISVALWSKNRSRK